VGKLAILLLKGGFLMEMITVPEAAKRKGCSRQAAWGAVKREDLDAQKVGRDHLVLVNKKFNDWQPNPKIQAAGRARWEGEKA